MSESDDLGELVLYLTEYHSNRYRFTYETEEEERHAIACYFRSLNQLLQASADPETFAYHVSEFKPHVLKLNHWKQDEQEDKMRNAGFLSKCMGVIAAFAYGGGLYAMTNDVPVEELPAGAYVLTGVITSLLGISQVSRHSIAREVHDRFVAVEQAATTASPEQWRAALKQHDGVLTSIVTAFYQVQ